MSDAKPKLLLESFVLGMWQTNCFVLHEEGSSDCWIIDAGFDPQPMLEYIQQHNLTPTHLILTHAHLDHIAGIAQIREQYPDIPILIHKAEEDFLTDTSLNLSAGAGIPIVAPPATGFIEHGDKLTLGSHTFEARHTPGHSPGGLSFYQPDSHFVIAGDTLFAGSVGRYDFPTSDGPTLGKSILEQLYTLPDDTTVYPGHGPSTSIGQEKQTNPYVRP